VPRVVEIGTEDDEAMRVVAAVVLPAVIEVVVLDFVVVILAVFVVVVLFKGPLTSTQLLSTHHVDP